MNAHYVIYDKASGEIVQCVFCQKTVLNAYTENGALAYLETKQPYSPDKYAVFNGAIVVREAVDMVPVWKNRQNAYPPLSDLADALYWQSQGDNSKMTVYLAACESVKSKFPKIS